jgi:hypothetical protein
MSDKATTVVESGIAIGALCITRQVALRPNKDTVTFQVAIDSTAGKEELNLLMDTISDVADRERMKADLGEHLEALKVAQAQPLQMDKEVERLSRDRATALAGMQARHSMSRKRLDFQLSPQNQSDLDKYDAAIANAKLSKKNFARDIPIIEWEVACLRAQIAGNDEPPKPPELEEALHDLALQEAAE